MRMHENAYLNCDKVHEEKKYKFEMIFSAVAMMLLSHKTGYHDSFDVCKKLNLLLLNL